VLSTSGGLGEAETAGVVLNVIPRDGGNTFSGTVVFSGANSSMQSSNYTQAVERRRPQSPSALIKGPGSSTRWAGGRIVRDRLWFFLTYREVLCREHHPGMFFNKNAGDPTKWDRRFRPQPTGVQRHPREELYRAPSRGRCRAQQDQLSGFGAVRARATEQAADSGRGTPRKRRG